MSAVPKVPVENGIYKHFKGNYYRVLGECIHEGTEQRMVRYQALMGGVEYVRELSNFVEWVELETCKVPRFVRIPS